MVRVIRLAPQRTDEQLAMLEGRPVVDAHFDQIVDDDVDGVDAVTGRLIFRCRKGVLPPDAVDVARDVFADIDDRLPPSYSRRSAAGVLDLERTKRLRPDVVGVHPDPDDPYVGAFELAGGRVLKKQRCNPVGSFMAGYNFDRFRRLALPTGFTKRFPDAWGRSVPFFEAVGACLERLVPDVSQRMIGFCRSTGVAPGFTIGSTCLTTVAVNVNYDSCLHWDRGDWRDGYSTLTAIGTGAYAGGEIVFPKYAIAVDVREGDLLVNQSHVDLHGNRRVDAIDRGAKRISFVTYLKATLAQARNLAHAQDELPVEAHP